MLLFAETVLFCICLIAVTSSVVCLVSSRGFKSQEKTSQCTAWGLCFLSEDGVSWWKTWLKITNFCSLFSVIHECTDLGIPSVFRVWDAFTAWVLTFRYWRMKIILFIAFFICNSHFVHKPSIFPCGVPGQLRYKAFADFSLEGQGREKWKRSCDWHFLHRPSSQSCVCAHQGNKACAPFGACLLLWVLGCVEMGWQTWDFNGFW